MSELTGDDQSQTRHVVSVAAQTDTGNVFPTPLRNQFEDTLASVGWSVRDLTPDQLRLLAGMMTERQRLLETVSALNEALEHSRHQADYDDLIHVYNRRAFMRELNRQLSFCFRYETGACLIYLDLDQFKAINDRFGHSTGDIALKKFGEILIAHTRESDLVGRIGGDEFAVLLINADEEDGQAKARMFQEDVQKLRFGELDTPIGFGLSCGVISWKRGEAAERLLERADEAMYADKRKRSAVR